MSNYGYDHEGYAAQVLDDGSLIGTYSNKTEPRMVGQVVAACGCGWTGATRYPTTKLFDEAAEELAPTEWEHDHTRSTLEAGHVRKRIASTGSLQGARPSWLPTRSTVVVPARHQQTAR